MSDKKKILIFEDNNMMRSLLQTLLELEDFKVDCPSFPLEDPLEIIQNSKPDVIFMDINLQGTSGLSLLQIIRTTDNIKDSRIIISSGSDRKQESLDAGANSFLMKPFMPDELIHLIKAYTN
jgi:DNA-binding response OmpR family regulator